VIRPGAPGAGLTITGGTVVTPGLSLPADVLVRDGTVAGLHQPGRPPDGRRLDATGCLVLPGGVDPHCHVMGDIASATRAAALGGTTTVLSFTNPEPGEGGLDCLLRRRSELSAHQDAAVDVGLHAMLYQPDHVSPAELRSLREAGACGVKVFLAYPELGIMWSARGLFELMTAAAGLGQAVQVHCEEGEVIKGLVAVALAAGHTGAAVFAQTRPPEAEAAAVARVLETAALTGARCYLTHLSCSQALDQVRLARRRGLPVHAEVCLHHLLLDDSHYGRPDAERYLVAPPLRPPGHTSALWSALADATLDTVGSDHSQGRSQTIGELAPDGGGYRYGIAGIGARVPLLLSHGLARGLPVGRLAELAGENPARAFGLHPRKGTVAPGADADLVVWDPRPEMTVATDTFDDGTGDSVYAGQPLRGRVRDVLLRGEVIVRDGRYVASRPAGRYLGGGGGSPAAGT
jgi:dihydropyrimidinase